jgi:hypothetical protein
MFQLSQPRVFRFGPSIQQGLTDGQEIETLVCISLAVICWSWVDGFVPGMLSGDTLLCSASITRSCWQPRYGRAFSGFRQ